jgi:FAD/FMN-containing dehydrogenase/Fe-S oxidoreductase
VSDDLVRDFLAALGPGPARCVDTSRLARALYSSDASIYRVVPAAVAAPRDRDELLALLAAARQVGLPVTARGAGTSCAGNAVGAGLVIDLRRHLNAIVTIDPDAASAVVEPGVVQASLQRALAPYNLRYGPDPSTANRCTMGGIVANNACGPRALGYGIAATNLIDAEIVTGTGEVLQLGQLSGAGAASHPLSARLADLIDANLGVIRPQFNRFSRQVSGYGLHHLLPESGRNLVRLLAGSVGTLGVATRLTVRLAPDPPQTLTVVLGYPSMAEAADAAAGLLEFRPTAVEGMDARLVEVVRRVKGQVPDLPRGAGWLFIEVGGDQAGSVAERARAIVRAGHPVEGWVVNDPDQAQALWRIRADGAGLAAVSGPHPAYPGWEDAAVPCQRLGAYLRDFEALLADFGFHALPYGHFGEGCVHARIDFPLTAMGGVARYRQFVTEAARLVAGHGGSLSGEHGDGRARSELLPLMYTAPAIALFDAVKAVFDPDNLLNPGVLAAPVPLDDHVRYAGLADRVAVRAHQGFAAQVHRCTGVGSCVAVPGGQLMCPSYQVTHQEQDSTRGRARVLQELMNGSLITDWDDPAVVAALDLCLACKGCRSDCPTGVDIASAKSYALQQRYRHRPRPVSHWVLGWLPRWGRLVTRLRLGGLVNAVLSVPGVAPMARAVVGIDQRRPLPQFATARQTRLAGRAVAQVSRAARPGAGPRRADLPGSGTRPPQGGAGARPPVRIWADSFTASFEPANLAAMVTVLVQAGYDPQPLDRQVCCGLTWITTGQRAGAARLLRAGLDQLAPLAQAGVPIVGMEPSCVAVWRSDAAELIDDPRLPQVARAVRTLAELLIDTPGWKAPDLTGCHIVAQPHCHHASVLGWQADAAVLRRSGARVTTLTGCCGLAGNFGVEAGHYDTSVAVAETNLLPALRADPEAIILADGFSCRKQVRDLTGRPVATLAQLLAGLVPAETGVVPAETGGRF